MICKSISYNCGFNTTGKAWSPVHNVPLPIVPEHVKSQLTIFLKSLSTLLTRFLCFVSLHVSREIAAEDKFWTLVAGLLAVVLCHLDDHQLLTEKKISDGELLKLSLSSLLKMKVVLELQLGKKFTWFWQLVVSAEWWFKLNISQSLTFFKENECLQFFFENEDLKKEIFLMFYNNSMESCCALGSDWAKTGKSCDEFKVSTILLFDKDEVWYQTCLKIPRNPNSRCLFRISSQSSKRLASLLSNSAAPRLLLIMIVNRYILGLIVFWNPNSGLLRMKIIYLFIYSVWKWRSFDSWLWRWRSWRRWW